MRFWSERMGRRYRRSLRLVLSSAFCCGFVLSPALLARDAAVASVEAQRAEEERYRRVPMPEGFQVLATELEGPVFADSDGRTLYKWPQHRLRNGYSGEAAGTPGCYEEVLEVTAGLMSPYPAGIRLPDLDTRPACTDLWPPVLAEGPVEDVGKWSVVERRDGSWQWAYEEQPLYTSVRDKRPGDTYGGTRRKRDGDSPAVRVPVGPPPLVPPGFSVSSVSTGRLLITASNASVYVFDQDTAQRVACTHTCLENWEPLTASQLARARGEWSLLERSAGVRQWMFRGRPLYTYKLDVDGWSQAGSDVPGWSNVYTQRSPRLPPSFTTQATLAGNVLADAKGMTIYTYQCGDDSADQLDCDHPEDTQVYRLAMCGAGDPKKCRRHWPYVQAEASSRSESRAWTIVSIDPQTGRFADAGKTGSLSVWAYRDRPVYTYAGDKRPGDVNGGGTGEWRGKRNGLFAFWLRDDYMKKTL